MDNSIDFLKKIQSATILAIVFIILALVLSYVKNFVTEKHASFVDFLQVRFVQI